MLGARRRRNFRPLPLGGRRVRRQNFSPLPYIFQKYGRRWFIYSYPYFLYVTGVIGELGVKLAQMANDLASKGSCK